MKYEERESAQRPLIQLENLVKVYDTGALKVLGLKKINLTIHRGEFVAVMGHSGSGKSTLMNILGCLEPAYPGTLLSGWSGYGGHDARSAL